MEQQIRKYVRTLRDYGDKKCIQVRGIRLTGIDVFTGCIVIIGPSRIRSRKSVSRENKRFDKSDVAL